MWLQRVAPLLSTARTEAHQTGPRVCGAGRAYHRGPQPDAPPLSASGGHAQPSGAVGHCATGSPVICNGREVVILCPVAGAAVADQPLVAVPPECHPRREGSCQPPGDSRHRRHHSLAVAVENRILLDGCHSPETTEGFGRHFPAVDRILEREY